VTDLAGERPGQKAQTARSGRVGPLLIRGFWVRSPGGPPHLTWAYAVIGGLGHRPAVNGSAGRRPGEGASTRRKRGFLRQRGNSFQVLDYAAGPDPLTGKDSYLTESTRDRREAEKIRTRLLAKVD
jgi:hypothetical protein